MDTGIGALAHQIAEQLGGFTARVHDHGACLHGPAGQELWVQRVWNHRDRVQVHGRYPPGDETYRLASHEITAAIARGPEAIARDITRRLLPAYRTDLQTARERVAQAARDDQHRARTAARLLATIPDARATDGKRETTIHWYDDAAGSGTIRLHGDGTKATIELRSAPTELASRIAGTVAALVQPSRT
jgi:hypothetical protein